MQKKDDGKNLMLEQNNIYHMSDVISRTSPHNFIKVKEIPRSAIKIKVLSSGQFSVEKKVADNA